MGTYDSVLLYLPSYLSTVALVSIMLADIWNLHLFRLVIASFCLSDEMTGVHVHMLNCLTAVYPVILMVTTYIAIELHARSYKVIKVLWKP